MGRNKLLIWGLATVLVVGLMGVGVKQLLPSKSADNAGIQTKLPEANNAGTQAVDKAEEKGLAQQPEESSMPGNGGPGSGGPEGGPRMMFPPGNIAQILGMTSEELQTQLKAGTTLEQIAGNKGMTLEQLKEKLLANTKTELDNQVSQGKLTAEQAQSMLTRLQNTDLSKLGAGPKMGESRMEEKQ